jgi:GntR family transcriptional repressor for pyruvate dehydrogenase complex
VVTPRLGELITGRLLALMRSGRLKEGSKLPPERELAELLGVSRTMVREALSALQLTGLLERTPGVGTVIKRVPVEPGSILHDYIEAGVSIAELIDARLVIDLGLAHVLCDEREYDLTEAFALLDVMRLEVRRNRSVEGYLPPSLDIHVALARATDRPLVTATAERLVELTRPHVWLVRENYSLELAQRSLELHERLCVAIASKDLISALAEVKSHYTAYPALK